MYMHNRKLSDIYYIYNMLSEIILIVWHLIYIGIIWEEYTDNLHFIKVCWGSHFLSASFYGRLCLIKNRKLNN